MASEYLMAILKSTVGVEEKREEGDGPPSAPPSFCPSSKNSSVGDFEDLDHRKESYTLFEEDTMGGVRSPGAARGRTVKEFEDQLTSLKKENFNLKLRIYFLEEKMGVNFNLNSDNIVKQNVELKVNLANLHSEANEKHKLLGEAVAALEIQDEELVKSRELIKTKEEEISQLQQELESVRLQLQDVRSFNNTETVSCDSGRRSEPEYQFATEFIPVVDSKEHRFGYSDLEKHQSQLANYVYDKAENLRLQIDSLQKDCELKDQTIESLNQELSSVNGRLIDFAQQVKEYEEKLAAQHQKVNLLVTKVQEEQKEKQKLKTQLAAVNQKFSIVKFEMEQEREELQRDRKSLERANMMLEMRVANLESKNRKQGEVMTEQLMKLERAAAEAKKNQELAVSCAPTEQSDHSNTDARFISVPDPETPKRFAQEGALHLQIESFGRAADKGVSASKNSLPSTPDGQNLSTFEHLLSSNMSGDTQMKIRSKFLSVKKDFEAQKQKIVTLKSDQLKACAIIKNMIAYQNKAKEEIAELKKAKKDLERELESVVSQPQKDKASIPLQAIKKSELNVESSVTSPANEGGDHMDHGYDDGARECPAGRRDLPNVVVDNEIVDQYKRLVSELEAKIEVLVETLKEKDSQMQYIRSQYDEVLKTLEEKENRITDLQIELLAGGDKNYNVDKSMLEKGDSGSEKHSTFYKQEMEEKNKEIERLNTELKKCTCYLQEIVNKELWEKNREIEKLHKKQESSSEVIKLKKELSFKESQLRLLKDKIDELGLDIKIPAGEEGLEFKDLSSPKRNMQNIKVLQDQLKAAKEEKRFFEERVTVLEQLDQEKEDLRVQLERSEQLRIETNDVCAALSSRLEELAVFLDSLLKQKSVLGLLGSAKNRKLREIISSSLDMSRSFNMSQLGNPDQSLAQLSNITAFLNGSVFQQLSLADEEALEDVEGHLSILPDNISLTYENHLYKKSNENERGNEEVIAALRQQVVNLKTELQVRDNELNRLQGDRESGVDRLSDSDGDNGAVQGFNLTPKSSSGTLKALRSEVNSESEAWSEPDRAVSRARIGLNRSIPVAHIPGSRYNHGESTEDEFFTPSKRRSTLIELSQDVHRLQQELDLKSEQFVENAVIYRQELEKLQSEAQESGEKFARAEVERAAALEKVAQLQRELDLVKEECKQSLLGKDKEMNNKINQLEMEKQRIMEESEAYAKQMLEALEKVKALEEYTNHMETKLRKEYEESVITKLKNAEETFAQKLKSVEEKCDAELKIAQENIKIIQEEYAKDYVRKSEAEKLSKELADLKSEVHSYEETIITYRELETTVQQYKKQIASLQADLDTTTALCCQLEKDNAEIGQEKLHLKDTVSQLKAKYEEQTAALQKQKSNLELRVSELESCNAELHNRLIKAQTSRFSLGLNATLPATIASAKPYIRQFSDHTYNSSEETADESHGFAFNKTPQDNLVLQPAAAEADRVESNSSPDLGIESDHGRFSSLETNGNNIIRPLLPTIELTESMNNLFDSQNIDPDANKSAHHCCQKSREIAEENNELKRKLHRMKTALEETATQLKVANQKKKLVEKNICKQLHKTSEVLRKAKVNLDSGSESDVLRS
ncbi:centrosomin isoform X2 [Anthonomus grandis grandis]|uniref:centrosomin isoform X2 n=1 Tax=Anthonomus grandis grandis TaxID=2921223 RepID=UPI0021654C0C|nr:centrosomin isoform X2 [Anthonomus grandis grandis]